MRNLRSKKEKVSVKTKTKGKEKEEITLFWEFVKEIPVYYHTGISFGRKKRNLSLEWRRLSGPELFFGIHNVPVDFRYQPGYFFFEGGRA